MKGRFLIGLGTAISVILVSTPRTEAQVTTKINEGNGDAGDVPRVARTLLGVGGIEITSISGSLNSPTDIDMFQFNILGAENFSANISSRGFDDTQLFLFNNLGFGVCANDDARRRVLTSTLTGRACGLNRFSSGIYYLAISGYNLDPISSEGLIFPDPPFDVNGSLGTFSATESGGAKPVFGWTGSVPGDFKGGTYMISLKKAFLITQSGGNGGGGSDPPLPGGSLPEPDAPPPCIPGDPFKNCPDQLPSCSDVRNAPVGGEPSPGEARVTCRTIPEPSTLLPLLGISFFGLLHHSLQRLKLVKDSE